MMIQLISEAETLAVGLSEVRDFLKISHNDEDAMIAGFIRAATAACETFTGRKLIQQQWQLTYNDWAEDVISIPLSPILSVDRIEVWIAGEFQEILPEKYLLDRSSYQARVLARAGDYWPTAERDIEGIKITVTAGFGAGRNDVPHDIRHGLLHWVAAAYEGGLSGNQAVKTAENLWQPYRRVAL
ncbi:hypothetical protein MNBD_ALPHA03-839 [hydrothermal vent metagenome]|uniref:Phage gp6-like head-tail connector protein n=1 Tax=hydrothermal vent metagenome TaxID=652676 RepID=A0A3B1AWI5_9ZZZZ